MHPDFIADRRVGRTFLKIPENRRSCKKNGIVDPQSDDLIEASSALNDASKFERKKKTRGIWGTGTEDNRPRRSAARLSKLTVDIDSRSSPLRLIPTAGGGGGGGRGGREGDRSRKAWKNDEGGKARADESKLPTPRSTTPASLPPWPPPHESGALNRAQTKRSTSIQTEESSNIWRAVSLS